VLLIHYIKLFIFIKIYYLIYCTNLQYLYNNLITNKQGTNVSLYLKLKSDRISAMKDRENTDAKIQKSVITTLLGELEQNAKRSGKDVSDENVIQACKKLIESNKEIMVARHSDKLEKENDFLNIYIPSQFSEEKLRKLIKESGAKDIGQAMGFLNKSYKGQFDGKLASTLAREMLANP
jgi:uncharacterized protein